ncbi:putative flippase GtrA [Streptomyces sp. DSM 40167]|nr:putative flippase GtrA [Streptomyces sp. DSM 40167]
METVTVTVAADRAPGRPHGAPGALAAFARFVLCGGGLGLASSVAVAALAAWLPWALANAVITVVSTLLATELHARFTFGAGGRATWRQHTQSAGSAAAAYAATCAAMLALHQLVAAPGAVLEQIVYLSASALAGVARFAVLRLVVFNRRGAVAPRAGDPEATGRRAPSAGRYPGCGSATSVPGSAATRHGRVVAARRAAGGRHPIREASKLFGSTYGSHQRRPNPARKELSSNCQFPARTS